MALELLTSRRAELARATERLGEKLAGGAELGALVDASRDVCLEAREVDAELSAERYGFHNSLTDEVEDAALAELQDALLKLASAHDRAHAMSPGPPRAAALKSIDEFRQSVARKHKELRDFIACRGRTFAGSAR